MITLKDATITFDGKPILAQGIESIEWKQRVDAEKETIATAFEPITFSLRLFGEQLDTFRRELNQLFKLTKKQKRRRRAWFRREAQRVFRSACRQGVRLNASAAEVRRALERGDLP